MKRGRLLVFSRAAQKRSVGKRAPATGQVKIVQGLKRSQGSLPFSRCLDVGAPCTLFLEIVFASRSHRRRKDDGRTARRRQGDLLPWAARGRGVPATSAYGPRRLYVASPPPSLRWHRPIPFHTLHTRNGTVQAPAQTRADAVCTSTEPALRSCCLAWVLSDGDVWAARKRDGDRTSDKVAIKKIANCFVQATEAKRILRELRILRHLTHPNIIRIRDVLEPQNETTFSDLCVVFDFVDLDLRKLIASPQTITVAHVQWICHQILAALLYLHSAHVLHRDLKPANVLLSGTCEASGSSMRLACSHGPERSSPRALRRAARDSCTQSLTTSLCVHTSCAGQDMRFWARSCH